MDRIKRVGGLRGFTLTEVVVVMGIVGMLASVLLPAMARVRREAKLVQCTNNLRQLGQALMMYTIDHSSGFERYPDRLTHMRDLGYVRDERIFICPMDYTQATGGSTALKPYFSANLPKQDFHAWAERDPPVESITNQYVPPVPAPPPGGYPSTRNCSYIYEFSTRVLQTCTPSVDPQTGQPYMTWGSAFYPNLFYPSYWLVSWYSIERFEGSDDALPDAYASTAGVDSLYVFSTDDYLIIPANPRDMDRDGDRQITMQEAKFWQLNNGDQYTTGWLMPGDQGFPTGWSPVPSDTCFDDSNMMREYPRSLMPMVRCFWHIPPPLVDDQNTEMTLNLAIGGNTFFSAPGWEWTAWNYGRTLTGY